MSTSTDLSDQHALTRRRRQPRESAPAPAQARSSSVRGGSLVVTEDVRATRLAAQDLVRHLAMGCVYGAAGLGKTSAVQHALEGVSADDPAMRTCVERFPAGWSRNEIATQLLASITGDPTHRGNLQRLSVMVADSLSHGRWLVVIDEAQNLTRLAMDFLRYLHDEPSTRFALLFVGGNGCHQTLSREPMLSSRIYWWHQFRPISRDEVPVTVGQLHPLLAGAEGATLLEVDDLACHGNWRAWTHFTRAALDVLQACSRSQLDREVIGEVLYQLSGGRPVA